MTASLRICWEWLRGSGDNDGADLAWRRQVTSLSGPAPIEFWFDFASGYAYFAALEVDALAARHGRRVLWRPFTLGAAFKVTGATGLSRTPLKKDYAERD